MSGAESLSAQAYQLWLRVKSIFPNAIFTSGARSASSNSGIRGASKTSQHLTGDAFDFVVPGVDPMDVQRTLVGNLGVPFGQSIAEYGAGMGPRNHLSTGSRNQLLTANNGVYRVTGTAPTSALTPTTGMGRADLIARYGPTVGNALADALAATGTVLEAPAKALEGVPILGSIVNNKPLTDWDGWFKRIALVVFALIFIAAAVFAFKGSDAINMVSKARKVMS